ncbi:MAG: GNAT family N-acetyltransferase [Cyanobacteria bacterium RM1_2_2]|nr:GNAT family N-acetyltransferase [Cyanobacteria bacterium RM1_2_2]
MDFNTLKITSYTEARADIQAVRCAVFQIEQGVEASLDFDGLDEVAQHIIVFDNEVPIGTARIRYLNRQLAKIERVAVLPAYRNKGIGRHIMQSAIAFLDQQGIPEIKVNSQINAALFYEKLGFRAQGEEFYEANILHIEMRRIHPKTEKS